MMLLEITSLTWLVTGLGFAIVLLLLFCFVYIMMGLGAIMQKIEGKSTEKAAPKKATTYATDADGATKAAIATALNMNASDEEKAAVAYAMHLYYNSLHDIEAPRLTLTHHCEAWKRK